MPQSTDVGHATVARAAKKKGVFVRRFSHNHQCGHHFAADAAGCLSLSLCLSRAGPASDSPTTTNAGNQTVQRRACSQTVAIVSASWAPLSTNMALERR
jgi:hypothetical protein